MRHIRPSCSILTGSYVMTSPAAIATAWSLRTSCPYPTTTLALFPLDLLIQILLIQYILCILYGK